MLKLKLNAVDTPKEETPTSSRSETPASDGSFKLSLSLGAQAAPKIKVKTNKQTFEGYDSEAPDREEDPTLEEAIVLRMMPGPGLESLQKAAQTGDMSEINIKFEDTRRAIVSIHGDMYAAQLLDLPTVSEVQKTFDRKNIYKGLDVCQMLLVCKKISSPQELDTIQWQDYQYQHGITPPLHNVRNRRFHKRLSNKVIETLEARVDELFRKDAEAEETHYELLPASAVATQQSLTAAMLGVTTPSSTLDEDEEDAEDDDDMAMELARALEEDNMGMEASEPSDASSDGGSDASDDDLDEDQQDSKNQNKLLREEIRELQATIETKQRDADNTVNQIMKGRLVDRVGRMRKELEIKQGLLEDAEAKETERFAAAENTNGTTNTPQAEDEDEDMEDEEEDDDVESLF
ncbi:Transcription initiation factor TFIID subunit 7 [Wickerhamiella sorbophila]|uniref:Transcription initiation factor TFIID subunit 7 n=1 Tax=Wickerhamiella sorbophila TaxID=45607 RepID=A0A2T0FN50_9ASCO|nr:Transcription initiation factor TFIID subunit 7 [Wickerhamiella sorbophila]PRT56423.1 Transcription initiation factor TFIID subunit 7 [Wickerhamiella sorbophila]